MEDDPIFLGGRDAATVALERRASFSSDGFTIFSDSSLSEENLHEARRHLQNVFRGAYDENTPPTKPIKNIDTGFDFERGSSSKPSGKRVQTMHVINAWRCDSFYRRVATSKTLGTLVAHLCGWESRGCRFAQDQVWVKPPRAGPLSFHRDTTYFDFKPKEVATVWFALDDTYLSDDGVDLGPLEYCVGSHHWGFSRRGSANQFFDPDYRCMLRDAAAKEMAEVLLADPSASSTESSLHERLLSAQRMEVVRVSVPAGGFSVHDGNTWHGSGPNKSETRFRRGIGLHFIPGDAVFDVDDLGSLWRPYCPDTSNPVPPDESFPWVYRP